MQTIVIPFSNSSKVYSIYDFRKFIRQEVSLLRNKFNNNNINTDLFHNHIEGAADSTNTITRYPRVLYQITNTGPLLVGLGEGAKAIALLYENRKNNWNIPKHFPVKPLDRKIATTNSTQFYKLENWLGLKEDTYVLYTNSDKMVDKIPILEQALRNNLIRFLKFSGELETFDFKLFIAEIHHSEFVQYKQFSLLSFSITFGCNLVLPDSIGLGKACSHGFGRVTINRK